MKKFLQKTYTWMTTLLLLAFFSISSSIQANSEVTINCATVNPLLEEVGGVTVSMSSTSSDTYSDPFGLGSNLLHLGYDYNTMAPQSATITAESNILSVAIYQDFAAVANAYPFNKLNSWYDVAADFRNSINAGTVNTIDADYIFVDNINETSFTFSFGEFGAYISRIVVTLEEEEAVATDYTVNVNNAPLGAVVMLGETNVTAGGVFNIVANYKLKDITASEPEGWYAEKSYDAENHIFTVNYFEYLAYTVSVTGDYTGAGAGVIYNEQTYGAGTLYAKSTITSLDPAEVKGYTAEVTIDGYNIVVTYTQKPVPSAPWSTGFTKAEFEDWTIQNNTTNGWMYDDYRGTCAKYDSNNQGNDYLFLTPVHLEAGTKYEIVFTCHSSNYNNYYGNEYNVERAEVLYGLAPNSSAMTATAIPSTDIKWNTANAIQNTINISETGNYYFGLHFISDKDLYYLIADGFSITPVLPAEPAYLTKDPASPYYYGTYYADYDWTTDAEVAIYVVNGINSNNEAVMSYLTSGAVPANTGVILVGEQAGEVAIERAAAGATLATVGTNLLDGVVAAGNVEAAANETLYKLSFNEAETKIGFYWDAANGASINAAAYKAFLRVPGTASNGISFKFEDASGINAIATESNDVIYNLQGQRVNANAAGVYVKNGKKFIVK